MNNPLLPGLKAPALLEVFQQTETSLGIKAHMIEKDAWVCWTLRQLFELPGARDHFIFKGGTSLSKVWKVVHRFSEDIDLSLSREWLGFTGDRDPEKTGSGKKRQRLLKELAESCATRLREEVLPTLRRQIEPHLDSGGWSLEISPTDSQAILFAYPSVFPNDVPNYIPPIIKMECGARSDRWPSATQSITPYIAEAFPDRITGQTFTVPVLDIERTFWEKATILHAEAHRPSDKPMPDRFSRHYVDLAALASHDAGAAALARDDLRARVVAHKQVFFSSAWASYPTAVPGTFKLLPATERLTSLERDYQAMQDMFFITPPPWDVIIQTLTHLEKRINALAPPSLKANSTPYNS